MVVALAMRLDVTVGDPPRQRVGAAGATLDRATSSPARSHGDRALVPARGQLDGEASFSARACAVEAVLRGGAARLTRPAEVMRGGRVGPRAAVSGRPVADRRGSRAANHGTRATLPAAPSISCSPRRPAVF